VAYPGDRPLIAELYLPLARLMQYYGPNLNAAHMPFNFSLLWASWLRDKWKAEAIARLISDYEAALPGASNWVLGTDQRGWRPPGAAQARVAMVLLLTLRYTDALLRRRTRP
jgi:alpha-glucosidase